MSKQLANEQMTPTKFHDLLVSMISGIGGVKDVKNYFEDPNKYDDTTTKIYWKCHVEDRWNYRIGEISVDYRRYDLFIPEKGYSHVPSLTKATAESIIQQVRDYYNL